MIIHYYNYGAGIAANFREYNIDLYISQIYKFIFEDTIESYKFRGPEV